MNSKVRNLFRNESKDIESFTNFNQVYFVFEQMVEYDVDVPEIEDIKWSIKNENCNSCPCEYADFSTDLTR